jgi:MFS family permease
VTQRKLYPWTALVLLTTLNFLNYIDRSVLFAVQPLVQTEFRLTNAQVGYLTSAFLLFYMVAAPFVGPLADRYSRKLIIVLGAVFWSGLTLMTAVTHLRRIDLRHTLVWRWRGDFVTITFLSRPFPENKRGRIFDFLPRHSTRHGGDLLGWLGHGWRYHVAAFPVSAALAVWRTSGTAARPFDSSKETQSREHAGRRASLLDGHAGRSPCGTLRWEAHRCGCQPSCRARGVQSERRI